MEAAFVLLVACVAAGALCLCLLPSRRTPSEHAYREARQRAEDLLAEVLGEEEYRELKRRGYLEIPSPSWPSRVYRVPRSRDQVRVYESGRALMRLCVGPVERVPDADVVLIHKLMIEGDEQEYLRIANRW
ncbi:MAG: hypothetical protein M3Q29_24970 [Chloroflexota bacterium]|nr:hypothetical protein [Chloroflexota bacterium]